MTWRSLGMALVVGAATVTSTGCTGINLRQIPMVSQKSNDSDPIAAKVAFARLCERHGQTEQARQTYQSLLKTDPRMQTPLHRLAVMSARQGKFDEANQYFEKALAAGAPTAELLSDHGYCLYLEDRLPEAEQELRDAMTLDPQYKAAKVNLGLVLGQQERLGESFAAFKDAVGEAQAYANLAYVHAQRNDFQQAEMLYSRALSTNPEMRSAALALVQLNDAKKRQQDQSGVKQAKANEPVLARQPKAAEDDLAESRRSQPMTELPMRSTTPPAEPRTAATTVAVDKDRNATAQQPSAISSEKEPPRQAGLSELSPSPITTQVRPATSANKPTENAAAGPSETASRSFVPRLQAAERGHEWRTGTAPQHYSDSYSAGEPPRPTGLAELPAKPVDAQPRSTSTVHKSTDKDTAGETASRSFVPRLQAAERGHEWRTGTAPQHYSDSYSAGEPPRPTGLSSPRASEWGAPVVAKTIDTRPTDKAPAGASESGSPSVAPRPQPAQMGQTSEPQTAPSSAVSKSAVHAPRPTQSVSDLTKEEIPSKSASTLPPIQVTTRQPDQKIERPLETTIPEATITTKVTRPSPEATSAGPMTSARAFQATTQGLQPQVIDMTKVQGKAQAPAQSSQEKAPTAVAAPKKPLLSEKGKVQSVPTSVAPQPPQPKALKQDNAPQPLMASTTTPSTPVVQSITRKTPDANTTSSATSKDNSPPKPTEIVVARQPSASRAAQTPPAPPVPPSQKTARPTETTPFSAQASALNLDSPTAKMSAKPAETYRINGVMISDETTSSHSPSRMSGANSPARLDPTSRTDTQQPAQPTNAKKPAGRKPFDSQRNEGATKPATASNDAPLPSNRELPEQNSSIRYVEYRDMAPTAAGNSPMVQPAMATDMPESKPSVSSPMPFSYPSTNHPAADTPTHSQGARPQAPSASPAAADRIRPSARMPAATINLPGYAGASD